VTPTHIVPEWYFLPLYAILRSVTDKLLGICLIILLIGCLFILSSLLKTHIIRSSLFKPLHAFFVWSLFLDCLLLGWIGGLPVFNPYIAIGHMLAVWYFYLLFILFPLTGIFEGIIYHAYLKRSDVNAKLVTKKSLTIVSLNSGWEDFKIIKNA
jgi:ubiquinol-cytochrome c reductase cytochrome b subunit